MTQPAYKDLGVLQYETFSMGSSNVTQDHSTNQCRTACYDKSTAAELIVAQPQPKTRATPAYFQFDGVDAKGTEPQPWKHNLCGCCAPPCHPGLFFNALCCPCIAYGRINHRDKHGNDMTDYRCVSDGPTWFYCIATYFTIQPILTYQQLQKIRNKYNIAGGGLTDCLEAFYCQCCSLIRTDKEMRERGGKDTQSGGHTKQYENHDLMEAVPQSDGPFGEI